MTVYCACDRLRNRTNTGTVLNLKGILVTSTVEPADCKSVYSGSIPDEASNFPLEIKRTVRIQRHPRRTRRHNSGHRLWSAFHGLFQGNDEQCNLDPRSAG